MKSTRITDSNDSNYRLTAYVATGVVAVAGIFLVYQMFANGNLHFTAQWNMFKSFLLVPLWIVGLIIAVMHMGKNHYSYDIYEQKYDGNGSKVGRARKSQDVLDTMEGGCLAPLFGHFVIEPLMWAALIYYPLMVVVAIVGAFVPYILTVVVIALCILVFMFPSIYRMRYRYAVLVALAVVLTGIFTFGGFAIKNSAAEHPAQNGGMGSAGNGSAAVSESANSKEAAEGQNDWLTFELNPGVKHCEFYDGAESSAIYDFNEQGALTMYGGVALGEEGSLQEVKRDATHRIVEYTAGEYDCIDTCTLEFDASGRVSKSHHSFPEGDGTTTYEYNDKGFVSKETYVSHESGMGGDPSEATEYRLVKEYTYQEVDSHGNWTKRMFKDSDGESGVQKRTITYYD